MGRGDLGGIVLDFQMRDRGLKPPTAVLKL